MKCNNCGRELEKGYCYLCYEGMLVELINKTYLVPKYSEIIQEISELKEQQEKVLLQLKELNIRLKSKKVLER